MTRFRIGLPLLALALIALGLAPRVQAQAQSQRYFLCGGGLAAVQSPPALAANADYANCSPVTGFGSMVWREGRVSAGGLPADFGPLQAGRITVQKPRDINSVLLRRRLYQSSEIAANQPLRLVTVDATSGLLLATLNIGPGWVGSVQSTTTAGSALETIELVAARFSVRSWDAPSAAGVASNGALCYDTVLNRVIDCAGTGL